MNVRLPLRFLFGFVLVAGLSAVAAHSARSSEEVIASAQYQLTFAGIPFGATTYDGMFGAESYSVQSHFKTSGLVSVFWQAEIDASAKGTYDATAMRPALYESHYQRGSGRKQRVNIVFGKDVPSATADPPYDTTSYPVSDSQKKEALDPLSAVTFILAGLKADARNPCGTVVPVFDGRRRYNLTFTYLKDEPVKLGKDLFSGTAHLCQIHYEQIAGYKPKILKEGKSWPPIFGYFTNIPSEGAPHGRYVVALKVWADMRWGRVESRLTRRHIERRAAG